MCSKQLAIHRMRILRSSLAFQFSRYSAIVSPLSKSVANNATSIVFTRDGLLHFVKLDHTAFCDTDAEFVKFLRCDASFLATHQQLHAHPCDNGTSRRIRNCLCSRKGPGKKSTFCLNRRPQLQAEAVRLCCRRRFF